MTTHSLLDAAAFLGALILFLLAGLAVIVVVAGVVVAIVGSIARTLRAGRPRDRVVIDHDKAGLHVDGPVDPEVEKQMREAFEQMRSAGGAQEAGR